MQETVLVIGIACVIGAAVGGGLKVVNVELPLVASIGRQLLLAAIGIALIGGSFLIDRTPDGNAQPPRGPVVIPTAPGGVQQPQTDPPRVSLSRTSGPPGTSLTVSGSGFSPGESVVVSFHTTELTRIEADVKGAFGTSVRVPANWSFRGQFFVIARGESSLRSQTAPFQVT
jgi:hypothetical protein